MKTIGYLRVSTEDQTVESQRLAIYDAGYSPNEWLEAVVSGKSTREKRKIDLLLQRLKRGDKIVVSELSRLGRSLGQIVLLVDELKQGGIGLHCIKEGIKIDDSGKIDMQSKVMVILFGLFAEIERDLISERTKEGLARAKKAGIKLGRPRGLGKHELDQHKEDIKKWIQSGVSMASIAKMLKTP